MAAPRDDGERQDPKVLREELDVAREQLAQAEEAFHYLETRLKKTQDEQVATLAAPSPEMLEQVSAAERDREMAVARAELAEHRLAEMQQRLDRLSRDPSMPPPKTVEETPPVEKPTSEPSPQPAKPTAEPSAGPAPAGEPGPAGEADEREGAGSPADPAGELRARLARTAARKKLGPNVSDG
jgi:hypothetical protein